jgi:glutamate-5-semialdehyde dehydrogenase
MSEQEKIITLAEKAKNASRYIARLSGKDKNALLHRMAGLLTEQHEIIQAENRKDVVQAREKGVSKALIDRLILNEARIKGMAEALKEIAQLSDPVGEINHIRTRPNGIQVGRMAIPLGVILMIYEARPNVTSDAAGLCLKAGNAVILRGGSEAFHSNTVIVRVLHQALQESGLPEEIIAFVPSTDRENIQTLLKLNETIDLVIPRGGEGLIRFVDENSRIPVIKHYKGVCHLYVDQAADPDVAMDLLVNGKTSRPGVCNALETLLIHEKIAEAFLNRIEKESRLKEVTFKGCSLTQQYLSRTEPATEEDYFAEYLDLTIAVKCVSSVEEAIDHIEKYGSNHTEVIATQDIAAAQQFIREVDSSVVMVNASSRFSDGGQLGLGAEIGISTTKLHAYGPMGVESLTTKKFVVMGEGQVRE